jgi:hypothetical protein
LWMNMICVATNMMKTCSFLWFVCTHVDDDFDILPYVSLPNSPLIASRMLITCSFQSLERNNMHVFQHEMDTMVFSNFDGVFVFPHLEDSQTICLHIDLAYAFPLLYLCWYGHEGGGEAQFQDSTKMREAHCRLARQDDLRYEII